MKFLFQFSYEINEGEKDTSALMWNQICKNEDDPFSKKCENTWKVWDPRQKNFTFDRSISLQCIE